MRVPPLKIRSRVVLLLLAFGLIPALLLAAAFLAERSALRASVMGRLSDAATTLNDTIDRNLFERYGDVQAFGLNTAAHDPTNWRRPGAGNPLVQAMDQYVAAYGVYKVSLLVDPQGAVLAVNSRNATGSEIATTGLYARSFAGAPWLGKALRGEFLKGQEGLTGTVVEPPARSDVVTEAFPGEDGYSIVFAAPVLDQAGTLVGVWANFTDFGLVEQIVADFHHRLATSGMPGAEVNVLDAAGVVIVDYDPSTRPGTYSRDFDVVGKLSLASSNPAAMAAVNGGEAGALVTYHLRKEMELATGYARSQGAMGFAGLGWSVLVRVPVAEAFVTLDRIEFRGMLLLGMAMLATLGLGLWIGAGFARPVGALASAMRQLAAGEALPSIPGEGRRDEIGGMAAAVAVFRDGMAEAAALRAQQETDRQHNEAAKRLALQGMADRVEAEAGAAVRRIGERAREMAAGADSMVQTVSQVAGNSASVATAAGRALGDTQTVAAATEQLSASVREISAQITAASTTTRRAAERGQASEAVIRGLSDSAARVGQVVKLIADIAGRTNLLALNATIEAARAGEAGKGFAVVAAEVKQLAAQTAQATQDIGRQITEITDVTEGAVATVRDMATAVDEIDITTTAIAAAVEQQAAATREIARTVAQTALAAQEVADRIGEVSASAAHAGHCAADVQAGAAEASAAVEALQAVLVQIVRTATPEVSRRTAPRYNLPLRGRLEAGALSDEVEVADISPDGARLIGGLEMTPGMRGSLRVPIVATPLPFVTISYDGRHGRRVRFETGAAAQEALKVALARLLDQQPEAAV